MFYYYDPTYFLVIIAAVITMAVQFYMTSTFNKYQQVESKSGITASQAAAIILNGSGINNVRIGHVAGDLTDHYAPTKKELNLSDATYNSRSIASIGVAAHECGHAIQDHQNMPLLNFQMSIVPVISFASKWSVPIIILGIMFSVMNLVKVGIVLFAATLFYQLITLPIEFNASQNAITVLRSQGIMDESELYGVKKVLTAAALTYVAAAASTILQLLRLVLLASSSNRND